MRCSFFGDRMGWSERNQFGSMSLLIQRGDMTGQEVVSLTAWRERLCHNQGRFPKDSKRYFKSRVPRSGFSDL